MLPSADKLYGDADFIFQQDLAPAHTAKCTKSWFNDHGVTGLDWPANSPDLNPIENLWSIVKRKMRDTRPNNADELKAAIKETWASIPLQQCHKGFCGSQCSQDFVLFLQFYVFLIPFKLYCSAQCSTIVVLLCFLNKIK